MVKAGELIAEVDLEYLKQKNISSTTPVLICVGAENKSMETAKGTAVAGKTSVITLSEKAVEKVPETAAPETKKEKKKLGINFDFLQKLGKVLMTVIAVMPAAGLMLSVGKLVQMAGADVSILMTIGSTMENIGWAIIKLTYFICCCNRWFLGKRTCRRCICSNHFIYLNQPYHWCCI